MSEPRREHRGAMWQGALILTVLAAACTALVAFTREATSERIARNEQEYLERRLAPLLGGIEFQNSLTRSVTTIPAPHELPGRDDAVIYRVYADDRPAAALFVVSARDGFVGPIRLLIGVRSNGRVTAIRVLQHRETPGLGDMIELDKSDWLLQFDGKSLVDPDLNDWAIRVDGGVFDQLTGASVTPRAVVGAIRETLLYFDTNQEMIFSLPEADPGMQL